MICLHFGSVTTHSRDERRRVRQTGKVHLTDPKQVWGRCRGMCGPAAYRGVNIHAQHDKNKTTQQTPSPDLDSETSGIITLLDKASMSGRQRILR